MQQNQFRDLASIQSLELVVFGRVLASLVLPTHLSKTFRYLYIQHRPGTSTGRIRKVWGHAILSDRINCEIIHFLELKVIVLVFTLTDVRLTQWTHYVTRPLVPVFFGSSPHLRSSLPLFFSATPAIYCAWDVSHMYNFDELISIRRSTSYA